MVAVPWKRFGAGKCLLVSVFVGCNHSAFSEKSGSLQRCIGALEALAQLVLFLLQVKEEKLDGNLGTVTLQFRQLCDNASVTASTFKMLSMKAPLSHVLQTLGYFCCKHGAALHTSHIAGIRNEWADALSRGSVPMDFSAPFIGFAGYFG